MKNLRKVLASTDLSDVSVEGVRHALEMAHGAGAEVILYHVLDVGDDWFGGREHTGPVRTMLQTEADRLDRFLRQHFSDFAGLVEIRQKVELGHPAANILEMAEREGIDLIVMSTHGRTGIDHMLMGSVTEKVVARAPCPVLTIPPRRSKGGKAKAA